MRKHLDFKTGIYAFALLFLLVNAVGAATLSISPSTTTEPTIGDTVTVTVEVDATDLYSAQFDISFDASVMQCDSFTSSDSFIGTTIGFEPTIDNVAGTVSGYAKTKMGATGVSGSGTLGTLVFTTLSSGTSVISFSNVQLLDSALAEITTTTSDGSVVSGTTTTTTTTIPTGPVIMASSASAQVDGTISVTVTVSSMTDLYSVRFDLAFDPTVVECDSVTEGTFLGTTIGFDATIDNVAGTISGFAKTKTGATGTDGAGTIATIQFTALAAGTSALTLSNVRLLDSALAEIDETAVNGAISVGSGSTARRRYFVVTYAPASPAVGQEVIVTVKDQSTDDELKGVDVDVFLNDKKVFYGITDSDGQFSFTPIAGGTYQLEVDRSRYRKKEFSITVSGDATTTTVLVTTLAPTTIAPTTTEPEVTTTVAPAVTTTMPPETPEVSSTTWILIVVVVIIILVVLYLVTQKKKEEGVKGKKDKKKKEEGE